MPNIPHLRRTIASYLGHELTPEIALEIEQAAGIQDDRSIDPAQFALLMHGGLVYGAERFRDVVHELHLLHAQHWQETEGYRHGLELRPDYGALRTSEIAGKLVQFTVRRGAVLVGQLRMYLSYSAHTGVLKATEDTLYVVPDERGGMVGLRLMRYAEKCLLQIGVRHIEADSKLVNKADVLMRRMGYDAVATKFSKIFPEA